MIDRSSERWERDIVIAHIHGMLIGMEKDLSFVEFTRKWNALCHVADIPKKLDNEDLQIFKIINEIHLKIMNGTMDAIKDKDLPLTLQEDLLELAKMIEGNEL